MEGTVIESLIVEWRADYAKLRQDSAKIKALLSDTAVAAKANSGAFKASATDSSAFASALTALGGKAFLAIAAFNALKASVNTVKESIVLAMDVVESENLFETSLGNMADSVRAWSEEMASSLGLNADEIRKTVGLWYTMGESLGLTSDQALGMSKTFAQLKYDLMSFYNIDGSQADTIIKGLYSGETEPAKQIGVLLTEEVAKRALVTAGIVKEGDEVDSTTMLYGRYLAMMEQTATAQGDMARTIDSPANQMRVLEAQLRAAKLELGQAFLPLIQDALPVIIDFAKGLTTAAEAFGYFMDQFSGRKTYGLEEGVGSVNKATADGASTWDAYGSSANKALGDTITGVKKLKATIFGFDMLNVMSDDTSSTGSGKSPLDASKITQELNSPSQSTQTNNKPSSSNPLANSFVNGGVLGQSMLELDLLPDDITESTKTKLTPFLQLFMDTQTTVKKWAWSNTTVTKDMASTMTKATNDMAGQIKSAITDQVTSNYNNTAEYFKNSSVLSEKEEAKILAKIKSDGEEKRKAVDKYAGRIKEIYDKAAKENRTLTEDEQKEVNSIQEKMRDNAVAAMSSSAEDQINIMQYLKDNLSEISAVQAADIVKNSLEIRDQTIADAEDRRDRIIEEAKKMKEAGIIDEDTYAKIAENAGKSCYDTIAAAEKQHKKVVEEAKKQAGEHVNEVNWETGEIKTVWDVFFATWLKGLSIQFAPIETAWKSFWERLGFVQKQSIADLEKSKLDMNTLFPDLTGYNGENEGTGKNGLGNTSGMNRRMNLKTGQWEYYDGGGLPQVGEAFIARENGPEMVGRIGSRTAVANNDQIVSGIESGVYNAVSQALRGNGGGGDIHLVIQVGNKTLYDAVVDEAARQSIRSGKIIIPVGV